MKQVTHHKQRKNETSGSVVGLPKINPMLALWSDGETKYQSADEQQYKPTPMAKEKL